MNIAYQITADIDGVQTLTFLGSDGNLHSINSKLVNYADTRQAVEDGDLELATSVSLPLNAVIKRLSDNGFGYDDGVISVFGSQIPAGAEDILLAFARKTPERLRSLANFFARLSNNPSNHSVQQLFAWVNDVGLAIDDDGYILAHKGIRNGKSVRSGTAFVNGVKFEGQIPNAVGDTVSMPRNTVADAPEDLCSHGLHVGSLRYASTWAPQLITVRIDPADVVSVPRDGEKMRVSKYVVLVVNEARAEFSELVQNDDWEVDADDDYCGCEYCGC